MDVPLQIAFHNIDSSQWVENEIRARVDKLTAIYPRVIGCRVTLDRRARNVENTIPPVVRIELSLPGTAPLIVAYEPERLQQRFQNPDVKNAIHDAFHVAERRLSEWKEQRQGRTKEAHHDIENQFLGEVADIHPDKEHGFILTKEGNLLYFHRNAMLGGDFDALKRGDFVHYVEDVGDTGPLATKVRPAAHKLAGEE